MEKYRNIYYVSAGLLAGMAVLLYLLLAGWILSSGKKEVVRCSDFRTQPEAQARFLSDPLRYGSLDANHDQIACNNLPKY